MAPTGLSLVKRLPRAFSLERSSHMTPLPTFSLLPQNQGREAWRGDGCHCRHLGNCECEKDLKFVLWERSWSLVNTMPTPAVTERPLRLASSYSSSPAALGFYLPTAPVMVRFVCILVCASSVWATDNCSSSCTPVLHTMFPVPSSQFPVPTSPCLPHYNHTAVPGNFNPDHQPSPCPVPVWTSLNQLQYGQFGVYGCLWELRMGRRQATHYPLFENHYSSSYNAVLPTIFPVPSSQFPEPADPDRTHSQFFFAFPGSPVSPPHSSWTSSSIITVNNETILH